MSSPIKRSVTAPQEPKKQKVISTIQQQILELQKQLDVLASGEQDQESMETPEPPQREFVSGFVDEDDQVDEDSRRMPQFGS